MASAKGTNQTLATFDRKLLEFATQVEELSDEFAANDEGDIELRDVHTYIMELIKLIKIEIESSNMMANFILSTFVKEFVDYTKTQKSLKNLSATLQPWEINTLFQKFLQSKASLITLIDLKPTAAPKQQAPITPQQQQKPAQAAQQKGDQQKPTPVKQSQPPEKKPQAAVAVEEEGSEYEEIEEEFEEEIEEEAEEDFGDVGDLMAPAKDNKGKFGSPQKDENGGKSTAKKKKDEKLSPKVSPTKKEPERDKNKGAEALKQPKQVTGEKKKEQLFDDKAEIQAQQQRAQPEQLEKKKQRAKLPEIILPPEDENEFQGTSPVRQNLPDSPNVHQKKARKANNEHALSKNEKIPHLQEEKLGDLLNKQTMKPNEENQRSLLNMDKYLLESQDTYKSPGLLDDIPDYIRQLSSTNGLPLDLNDPQVQDAIQEYKKQITMRQQENLSPQTHYDERMLLEKIDDFSQIGNQNQVPKGKGSTVNGEKKNSPVSPNQQQFALNPIRNPSSDSLKEESKFLNTLNKKEPAQKVVLLAKRKRVFERVDAWNMQVLKEEVWYSTVSVSRIKAVKGYITKSKEENEERYLPQETKPEVVKQIVEDPPSIQVQDPIQQSNIDNTNKVKIVTDVQPQKQKQPQVQKAERVQPIVEQQQRKEPPKQPENKLQVVVNLQHITREYGQISYIQHMEDHWFNTLIIKNRPKAFFQKMTLQKEHTNEKTLKILQIEAPQGIQAVVQKDPPVKEVLLITVQKKVPPTAPLEPPLKEEKEEKKEKLEIDTKPLLTPKSVVVQKKVPPVKPKVIISEPVETLEEKKEEPSVIPPKPIRNDRSPPPVPEENLFEKAKKEKLDLEIIRNQAQKQYKREQALKMEEGLDTPILHIELSKPIEQHPSLIIKKKVPPKAIPLEIPNFAGQLRQTETKSVPKQRKEPKKKHESTAQIVIQTIDAKEEDTPKQDSPMLFNLIALSPSEDPGNHSDTSPERKNTKLLMNDAKSQLEKAIQLYDRMIMRLDTEDHEMGRHEMLMGAVTDLKEQLVSMETPKGDNLDKNVGDRHAFPSMKARTQRHNAVSQLLNIESRLHSSTTKAGPQISAPVRNQNIDASEQLQLPDQSKMADKLPVVPFVPMVGQQKVYDENAKRTIDQLKHLFSHYSKQKIAIKTDYTFEDFKEEQGILNLSKVIAFIQDFEVSISTIKVAELFKKCAIQSKYMHFDQFQEFIEKLYVRQFDTERDNLKRKLLSTNFKLKKANTEEEKEALIKEKAEIKVKMRGLQTLDGLEVDKIYAQIREDLKMDDPGLFCQRMRGYIPEYEKLPKIISIKAPSPKRMEIELAIASKGVPKIPELAQLKNIIRKNKEEEQAMRDRLREQSRSHRKNFSSLGPQLTSLIGSDLATMRQPEKIHRPSIDIGELDAERFRGRMPQAKKRKIVTIANTPEHIMLPDLIKVHDYQEAPSPMISRTLNKSALKTSLNPYNQKQYSLHQ